MAITNVKYKRFIRELYKKKDKDAISGIYKISCRVTNDFYIGSSTDINKRWIVHKFDLKHKRHVNYKLYNAYKEHGLKNLNFEIIYICSKKIKRNDLYKIEQKYIDDLKPGYNIQLIVELYDPKKQLKEVKRLKEGVKGIYLNNKFKTKNSNKKVKKEKKTHWKRKIVTNMSRDTDYLKRKREEVLKARNTKSEK